MTSPIAEIPGTLVRYWGSTLTYPFSSSSPTRSTSSPSVTGPRPVATSKYSARIVCVLPSASWATTSTRSPAIAALVNRAAAENGDRFRHVAKPDRFVAGDDALAIDADARHAARRGSGGDDDLLAG